MSLGLLGWREGVDRRLREEPAMLMRRVLTAHSPCISNVRVSVPAFLFHNFALSCIFAPTQTCNSHPADYGPYGFLERFDPEFTPNTTDLPGRRYCFRRAGCWGC